MHNNYVHVHVYYIHVHVVITTFCTHTHTHTHTHTFQVFNANSTQLSLGFHISNLFDVSLPLVSSPVSAVVAVEKLLNSAKDNDNDKLGFIVQLAPGHFVTPSLMFVRVGSETRYCSITIVDDDDDDDDDDEGLSDGAIAGIAIWMLILGVGIGIVATLIFFAVLPCARRRSFRPKNPVSYKKQEDEAVTVAD